MTREEEPSLKPSQDGHQRNREHGKLLIFFAALLAVTLLLRLPYAGNLFHDDGLWFTVGEELMRGKALYREAYLDKPPVIALVYWSLFKSFGAHLIVIRLFMIFYSVAISAVLYLFGSRLYDRRAGLLAAAMFTFFSTTSVNNHVQALNTDFVMLLPYTAGAFFLMRACVERRALFALLGGALVAVAAQTNHKGIFDLLFFAVLLVVAGRSAPGEGGGGEKLEPAVVSRGTGMASSRLRLSVLAAAGFAAGSLPFLLYLASTGSLAAYWVYVWKWAAGYAAYGPVSDMVGRGAWLTIVYLARNNTLLISLIFVAAVTINRARRSIRQRRNTGGADRLFSDRGFVSDGAVLLWLAASFVALSVGGRFYSNYFFQILPGLCLLGGRGLPEILAVLKTKKKVVRATVIAILALGFVITLVRFHTRTGGLALDWVRGTKSPSNARWYHERLNRDERMVAAVVRELPGGAAEADKVGREEIRQGGPRMRAPAGPPDYLFVWGSRAEIYYWSGLLPASRYLTTQPLTGVPADVHHAASRPVLDESLTSAARAQLIVDLDETQPNYIVDELGYRNPALSIQSYPELREFMKDYQRVGATGGFFIYRRSTTPR
ncbi:MAG TPA: glycosyltransferase family 39 protein [Blastocatellia bacterium]|nr:glycosyltransferase family 39 protein [Blastocatellia bacterium]